MLLNKFNKFQLENTANIKGGFRYVTKDAGKFVHKVVELRTQGKNASWDVHNGTYCVEW